jgi:UDP-GlcNAc:undecaprenyl-phosphate GlcNAc-1-phosphate transferase
LNIDLIIILTVLLGSAVLTVLFKQLITRFGGNLYTNIRGGTPRAVGIAPFIILILFLPIPGKYLIAIMGMLALVDDLVGRKKINGLKLEIGQLSRGIGMILVIIVGYFYFGPVSLLIALMIQPMNIADMQPGSACSTVILMSLLVLIGIFAVTSSIYIPVLILIAACLGYAPLDYQGRIMMGEIGNHTFAVGLGISFAFLGGILGSYLNSMVLITFLVTLLLFFITAILIAFIRRKNLKNFMEENLHINKPNFGDYVMDVLTGGGLGDLIRRLTLGEKIITIKHPLFIRLGFRRLFYNPYQISS